jgi:plasmid maintenance system antidote protein VapI
MPLAHKHFMEIYTLADDDLLIEVMKKYDWTQEELAKHLLFDRSRVSKVINGKTSLRTATRKKAEELLNDNQES